MSEIIPFLFLLFFIGGFLGIVALWTQRTRNMTREKGDTPLETRRDSPPDE
ncbi:MAG TPA: hypothetical protein VMZ27_05115 [Candidatus Saccharimonadales bacterium]|nr:hypothetical protein [Candidatus Saccharimonadales bacterium]